MNRKVKCEHGEPLLSMLRRKGRRIERAVGMKTSIPIEIMKPSVMAEVLVDLLDMGPREEVEVAEIVESLWTALVAHSGVAEALGYVMRAQVGGETKWVSQKVE